MKLFRFRGGVHPDGHKQSTACVAIETLPIPKRLYVPLQQHIGEPAEPRVHVGQTVLKGDLLGHSRGMVSAPVHAPTSGTVIAVGEHKAPHPSGLTVQTVVIESDGEDRWCEAVIPIDPFSLSAEEIAARVGAAGVVGLGGATFPSAVKLNLGKRHPIHTLIINGGECEPYLTCDDRLMRERPEFIIDGVRIMLHALEAQQALIAIEDNKPEALAAMSAAAKHIPEIEVIKVPTLYPMGSEKHMIQTLTGKEVPAGKLSADIGVLVHNVGTAYAVQRAVRLGRPLVSRVVTVGGGAVRQPKNLEVPIGTLVSDLLAYCGGLSEEPARLLSGGPMMGQVLPSADVPVVKGTSGIIALTHEEFHQREPMPCIRCARCVTACPCGLVPLEMAAHARCDDLEGAVDYGLMDCVACGSCAYVCPSNIPLVQYFNYAKGALAAQRATKQHMDYTRQLAEERQARKDREKQKKAEAAARRKAEKAQKATAEKAEGAEA